MQGQGEPASTHVGTFFIVLSEASKWPYEAPKMLDLI
jgi:hypothetical protein